MNNEKIEPGAKVRAKLFDAKTHSVRLVKGVKEVPGHLTSKTASVVGSRSRAEWLAVFL